MLRRNFDFVAVLCVLVGLIAISDVRRFERDLPLQPIRVQRVAQTVERGPCVVGRVLSHLKLAFTR
jgi:hypothetical protein